jgi:hypothetical protein
MQRGHQPDCRRTPTNCGNKEWRRLRQRRSLVSHSGIGPPQHQGHSIAVLLPMVAQLLCGLAIQAAQEQFAVKPSELLQIVEQTLVSLTSEGAVSGGGSGEGRFNPLTLLVNNSPY